MTFKRQWKDGARLKSIEKTNGGTRERFPGTILYDEDAEPVPLEYAISELNQTLFAILAEVRVIREHLEEITEDTITPDEADPL